MSSPQPKKPVQLCSDPGCSEPTAYRTRTRDAWCDTHISAILRAGGLEPLEPFSKSTAWRLTRCLACGCEAHYRFEYTLEKNASGEATCRACFWRRWAGESRLSLGSYANLAPVAEAAAREHAEAHGYDYLAPLTEPSLTDDPHHVRCRSCLRLSADRLGDIAFGCRCGTNPRRDRQTSPHPPALLKDSGLAAVTWWDHERNGTAMWETATVKARREAAWRCPHCDLEFTKRILDMVTVPECPACEPERRAAWQAEYERYRSTPVADVPELLAAWADDADPRTVPVAGLGPLRKFRCPQGHSPRLNPHKYLTSGCPSCRGLATRAERMNSAPSDRSPDALDPEIAAQWHPTRNAGIDPATVSPGSRKTRWWRNPDCGHEWQDTPAGRNKGHRRRCPVCRTVLDSLAYHFPELAAEWSPDNPLSAWHVRPTAQTSFVPTWICPVDPNHIWQASLGSRASGSECPQCREHGKSRIEVLHHAAAERAFGTAASGRALRHQAFTRRSVWQVDIVTSTVPGRELVIEYDGAYWHADKADLDADKTHDLLAAGYLVARLREHPLSPLPIEDPDYTEFTVHSTAPDPDAVINQVQHWAATRSNDSS
ncbi:zinc-ribbon domain-containing protein [Streptomyces sp. NPDC055078]